MTKAQCAATIKRELTGGSAVKLKRVDYGGEVDYIAELPGRKCFGPPNSYNEGSYHDERVTLDSDDPASEGWQELCDSVLQYDSVQTCPGCTVCEE